MNWLLLAQAAAEGTAQKGWSTELVSALLALFTALGGGIVWLFTVGLDQLKAWRTFRLQERAQLNKMQAEQTKPFTTEQMWEDKSLSGGYKALLYTYDKRIREMEVELKEVKSMHFRCLQEHAEASIKLEATESQLQDLQKKHTSLERKMRRLSERSHINFDTEEDPGDAANPS